MDHKEIKLAELKQRAVSQNETALALKSYYYPLISPDAVISERSVPEYEPL